MPPIAAQNIEELLTRIAMSMKIVLTVYDALIKADPRDESSAEALALASLTASLDSLLQAFDSLTGHSATPDDVKDALNNIYRGLDDTPLMDSLADAHERDDTQLPLVFPPPTPYDN